MQILTGHEKGVLSLSWCKQDADLLLSCGKDNRALCWNPQTSEIIGEVSPILRRFSSCLTSCSFLLRITGPSKSNGVLVTQICLRRRSLTAPWVFILSSLRMNRRAMGSQRMPLHLTVRISSMSRDSLGARRVHFPSSSPRSGFADLFHIRSGLEGNSSRSRICLPLRASTKVVSCICERSSQSRTF
jgi:WD40 repeat protein